MKTYRNALENRAVGIYSESKSYYEVAVSRYYYSLYLIINKYLIDILGDNYIEPPRGTDSHVFIINQFLDYIEDEIEVHEFDMLKEMRILRKKRNDYEYYMNFNGSERLFKTEFKTKYENIEGVLETHLLDYKTIKLKKKSSRSKHMRGKINNFIKQLKLEFDFKNKIIGFKYEEDGDFYYIWHTNEELESTIDNRKKVSNLLREVMTKEEARNVVVSYSYAKELELKEKVLKEWDEIMSDYISMTETINSSNDILQGYYKNINSNVASKFSNFVDSNVTKINRPIESKVLRQHYQPMKTSEEVSSSHYCNFNDSDKKSYNKNDCAQDVRPNYALAS